MIITRIDVERKNSIYCYRCGRDDGGGGGAMPGKRLLLFDDVSFVSSWLLGVAV